MKNEINGISVEAYWVIKNRFMAGEYPGSIRKDEAQRKLRWLIDLGINLFIDLTESGEYGLIPYQQMLDAEAVQVNLPVDYIRYALRDFRPPSAVRMVEILDSIDSALLEGKNIYLHCYGGKGRTGTVVGCYLVRHGLPGEMALNRIQELCSSINAGHERSPETDEQRNMVMEWNEGQ